MLASGKSFDTISSSSNVERCRIIHLNYVNMYTGVFQNFTNILHIPNTLDLYEPQFKAYKTRNITRKSDFKNVYFVFFITI